MTDRETGLSIRFIRQWKPEQNLFINALDATVISCAYLGHTFNFNAGEAFCNICGAPNPGPLASDRENVQTVTAIHE